MQTMMWGVIILGFIVIGDTGERESSNEKKDSTNGQSPKVSQSKDYTETVDGVSFRIVFLKSGSFMMGSPSTEIGRQNDETLHKVTLGSLYLAEKEATKRLFKTTFHASGQKTLFWWVGQSTRKGHLAVAGLVVPAIARQPRKNYVEKQALGQKMIGDGTAGS